MGLIVDIKGDYNFTRTDLKDVYIRIETLQVYPKQNAVRANVTGFINKESGQLMKQVEIAGVKEVEEFFFTNEILNGMSAPIFDRDSFIPPQTGQEPQPVFRDYYTIYLKDAEGNVKNEYKDLLLVDYEGIYSTFYLKMRQFETRFTNIRDDL